MDFVPELRLAIYQRICDGVPFFRVQIFPFWRVEGENILPFIENFQEQNTFEGGNQNTKNWRYNKNNCVRVVKEMYQFPQGRKDGRSYNHQIRNWFRKSPMD